jgi:hypothetical protein
MWVFDQDGALVTLRRKQSHDHCRSRSQSWDAANDDDLAKAIAASLEGITQVCPSFTRPECASITNDKQIILL